MKRNKRAMSFEGTKIKDCILVIWGHALFSTWIILKEPICIFVQIFALVFLFISIYCQLLLIKDYFNIKSNTKNVTFKKDISILEPLLPERHKTNDK